MQQQSSPKSFSTILILLLRELKSYCWWIWLLKATCMLQWYYLISQVRYYFDSSFQWTSNLLLFYSSLSFLIFSLIKSIFSSSKALFSVRIARSSWYVRRVYSRFLTIRRSQKVLVGLIDLIQLKFYIWGSYLILDYGCDNSSVSYLLPFSYSQRDSSSMKVLLCMRWLSSAYLQYFLLMVLRKSLAFLSPYFEFILILQINQLQRQRHQTIQININNSNMHHLLKYTSTNSFKSFLGQEPINSQACFQESGKIYIRPVASQSVYLLSCGYFLNQSFKLSLSNKLFLRAICKFESLILMNG